MSKWEEKRLEDIIDVNPPVKLKKGESYPFIDIDKVSPTRRSVTNEDVKIYHFQRRFLSCAGADCFPQKKAERWHYQDFLRSYKMR